VSAVRLRGEDAVDVVTQDVPGGLRAALADEELIAIRTPTLLLIGDRSPLLHAETTRDRVQRLMPNVDVELVTDTRHGPSIEHPEYVNNRILQFLRAAAAGQLPRRTT
jgi:pimeloyl-ACP methyl ester carboxylesterase